METTNSDQRGYKFFMIMLTRVIKSHASQDIISYFWYQYFSWRYIYKPMSPIMLRCIYVLIYRDGKINRIGSFWNKLCARLHCIITIMYKLVKVSIECLAQAIFIGLFECNGYDLNVSFAVRWATFSALKKLHNFICIFKGATKNKCSFALSWYVVL